MIITFGGSVDESADGAFVLLLELVDLFVLFEELQQLEGSGAFIARESHFFSGRFHHHHHHYLFIRYSLLISGHAVKLY